MGVYIKNMEMPVIELEWTIRRGADGKWYAIDTNAETSDGEWHEIVPVPPHGRLIDADALEVIGYCGIPQGHEDTFDSGVMWLAERIDKLPAIIPAEPAEEV